MKITKPRVDSETACRRTTKLRTQQLGKHRHLISGGSDMIQLQDEVKACTPAEREMLLEDLTKGGFKVAVLTEQALALKADLDIPWSKLRVVRRYNIYVIN